MDIREPRDVVQAFAREQGLSFPILLDETGDVAQQYRLRGIPTSFFIDRDGVIRGVHTGPLDASRLQTYLIRIP